MKNAEIYLIIFILLVIILLVLFFHKKQNRDVFFMNDLRTIDKILNKTVVKVSQKGKWIYLNLPSLKKTNNSCIQMNNKNCFIHHCKFDKLVEINFNCVLSSENVDDFETVNKICIYDDYCKRPVKTLPIITYTPYIGYAGKNQAFFSFTGLFTMRAFCEYSIRLNSTGVSESVSPPYNETEIELLVKEINVYIKSLD